MATALTWCENIFKSGLQSVKNKLWRFAECATPYNRPFLCDTLYLQNELGQSLKEICM